jgi:hypothetical protein
LLYVLELPTNFESSLFHTNFEFPLQLNSLHFLVSPVLHLGTRNETAYHWTPPRHRHSQDMHEKTITDATRRFQKLRVVLRRFKVQAELDYVHNSIVGVAYLFERLVLVVWHAPSRYDLTPKTITHIWACTNLPHTQRTTLPVSKYSLKNLHEEKVFMDALKAGRAYLTRASLTRGMVTTRSIAACSRSSSTKTTKTTKT